MANIKLLSELLETSANACENFIKSEIALNDGEIMESQKHSKNGQILMKALISDTFKEMEELGNNTLEVNDYDIASNMELIKALNNISKCVGSLLATNEAENDTVKNIAIKNLFKAINTAKEIYLSLFEN